MTTPSQEHPDLPEIISTAKPGTTVFADGSTYNLKEGYKSGGNHTYSTAKIVKHFKFDPQVVWGTVILSLLAVVVLTLVAMITVTAISQNQKSANHATIVEAMKADRANIVDGKVQSKMNGDDYVLIEMKGQFLKCDVTVAMHETPVGLIFCDSGTPAIMSVPVPHDPTNIFYKAADEEK